MALPTTHPIDNNGIPNAEVHNAGEIWATMVFEAYVALLKTSEGDNPVHTFAEARRLMADYIVGGMQAAPADPTFTEQRDSILAAAIAHDKADFLVLAKAFAKRGAGTCAESPARNSNDFAGVIPHFAVSPRMEVVDFKIDDRVKSCDGDGQLDDEEIGKVTVTVQNTGAAPTTDTTATVTTLNPNITFPQGANIKLGVIEPFDVGTATLDIALKDTGSNFSNIDLSLALFEPAACASKLDKKITPQINFDLVPSELTVDNIEDGYTDWSAKSFTKDVSADHWAREPISPTNHVWHGTSLAIVSDSALESPTVQVGTIENFVLTFKHRHKFKSAGTTFFAGGVVEFSYDGGQTWQDVSGYAITGYNGPIALQGTNPLRGRLAFVGTNPSYPAMDTVSIDFAMNFVDFPIKIRFRIGSDDGQGETGWEIDDIGFTGITNKPYHVTIPDVASCQGAPIADAGPDQTVYVDNTVTLDASKSKDPDNDPLSFAWTQIGGPKVTLAGPTTVKPKFKAPAAAVGDPLSFQLVAKGGKASTIDTVTVQVLPPVPSSATASSGSGTASSTGTGSGSGSGTSSSAAASSGAGGAGGSGAGGAEPTSTGTGKPDDPPEEGGCGCSMVGSEAPVSAVPLLGLLSLVLRRRRRQDQ